jgi:quercetin dioxygenase-like cupin family protein
MTDPATPLLLGPDEGRHYRMPAMRAVFKVDGAETAGRYAVSEWWIEPHSPGPGPHAHADNDEIFYGIGGTLSVLLGEQWHALVPGGFMRIPAGMTHDFDNRTDRLAGLLNLFIPGDFEKDMPEILRWYEENPTAAES